MAINHNKPQDQIPPIVAPQPDNITGNLNNNLKVQQLGANLFEGEALAGQEMDKRNLGKPVMPPSPDPMGDQYGNMFNQPFAQKKLTVHPVPQEPNMEFVRPTLETPITRPTKRIYKEMMEEVPKMTGLMVPTRIRKHEEKMEKAEMPVKVIQRVNMEGPLAQRKKGKKYTTGTGMDETDLEEGNFKSSRLGVYNNQYNIENVSNIQEDKKGQFMTTISDNESWDQSPRPKSSIVDNYNYKGVRDTLRPAKGKYFKMGWGENERNISRN